MVRYGGVIAQDDAAAGSLVYDKNYRLTKSRLITDVSKGVKSFANSFYLTPDLVVRCGGVSW